MCSLSTFSKSFQKSLCEFDLPEVFLEKLSEKPDHLLLFFKQACLNRNFVRNKFGLMAVVLIRINEFALSQVLDWDEVIKVYSMYLKFGERINLLVPNDLEIRTEENLHCYSRLVFMRSCSKLKQVWLQDPCLKEYELRDFAPSLNSFKELDWLYEAFLSSNYTIFHTVSDHSLIACLNQLKRWGCNPIADFDDIVGRRINRLQFALAILASIHKTQFYDLFLKCKAFLDHFQFYKVETDNGIQYSCYSFEVYEKSLNKAFLPSDLLLFSDSCKDNLNTLNNQFNDVYLEEVEFVAFDQESLMVRSPKIYDFETCKNISLLYSFQQKGRIDTKSIKKIISDGQLPMRDLALVGLLVYFDQVCELELFNYKKIDPHFIARVGEEKPDLKSLTFHKCIINDEIFKIIARLYVNLISLNIRGAKLSQEIITLLLSSLTNLKGILLSDCELSLPDVFNIRFKNIECIVLANLYINKKELDRVFGACENTKDLSVINVPSFSLSSYPYPEKIKSLMLDAQTLENEFNSAKDDIPVLSLYSNLEGLKIFGKPGDDLKKVLVRFMREGRFAVLFIKGDRF